MNGTATDRVAGRGCAALAGQVSSMGEHQHGQGGGLQHTTSFADIKHSIVRALSRVSSEHQALSSWRSTSIKRPELDSCPEPGGS